MNNKFLFAAIAILIVLQVAIFVAIPRGDQKLGFQTADNADIDGTLNVDGTSTLVGATTLSSTLSVSGDTTLADLIQGGGVYSTTSNSNTTTTAALWCDNSFIEIGGSEADVQLNIAATTTLYSDSNCLTSNGLFKEVWVRSSATSSGIDITLNTNDDNNGIELMGSSTDAMKIGPQQIDKCTLFRRSNVTTTFGCVRMNNAD